MPATTDLTARVIEGLIAIIEGDATIQGLCDGRTDGIVVEWNDVEVEGVIPRIAHAVLVDQWAGGTGETRLLRVKFRIVALTMWTCRHLAKRLEALCFDETQWSAHSLDAVGWQGEPPARADFPDDRREPLDRAVLDLDLSIQASQP